MPSRATDRIYRSTFAKSALGAGLSAPGSALATPPSTPRSGELAEILTRATPVHRVLPFFFLKPPA